MIEWLYIGFYWLLNDVHFLRDWVSTRTIEPAGRLLSTRPTICKSHRISKNLWFTQASESKIQPAKWLNSKTCSLYCNWSTILNTFKIHQSTKLRSKICDSVTFLGKICQSANHFIPSQNWIRRIQRISYLHLSNAKLMSHGLAKEGYLSL